MYHKLISFVKASYSKCPSSLEPSQILKDFDLKVSSWLIASRLFYRAKFSSSKSSFLPNMLCLCAKELIDGDDVRDGWWVKIWLRSKSFMLAGDSWNLISKFFKFTSVQSGKFFYVCTCSFKLFVHFEIIRDRF